MTKLGDPEFSRTRELIDKTQPALPGLARPSEPVQQPIPGLSAAQDIAGREARYNEMRDDRLNRGVGQIEPAYRLSNRLDNLIARTDATKTATNTADHERAGLAPGQAHETAAGWNDPNQRIDVIREELGPIEATPQPGFIRRTAAELLAAGEKLMQKVTGREYDNLILPDRELDDDGRGDRW